jgi:iron complex transport system permease protein
MGGFSNASSSAALMVWLSGLIALAAAWICGRRLDAISLGDDAGMTLGVDERRLRPALLVAVSLPCAVGVSFFGIIGFVGLVVPHIVRMLVGSPHRPLLLFSFLGGAVLMACADGAAQACRELPVGVITALAGAPFFCWLMTRRAARH